MKARILSAFANNRSRVALGLGTLVELAIVIGGEALNIAPEIIATLAAAVGAKFTAYIVGNGLYERTALDKGVPATTQPPAPPSPQGSDDDPQDFTPIPASQL